VFVHPTINYVRINWKVYAAGEARLQKFRLCPMLIKQKQPTERFGF